MNVHFVDTSILTNLLKIPHMAQNCVEVQKEYTKLSENGDAFVFPTATLIETGNHIAHIADGNTRRDIAKRFVELVSQAAENKNNMSLNREIKPEELKRILDTFPDAAMRAIGFGDVSIVEQFEEYWNTKPAIGEIRIWSLDEHLASHVHMGGFKRRREK